jgi:hypothetical protein
MERLTNKVVMSGAAWLASFIASFSRSKWIERNMPNPHVFNGKTENERAEMLGQVWDIADRMERPEQATPGATILNTSKRKKK